MNRRKSVGGKLVRVRAKAAVPSQARSLSVEQRKSMASVRNPPSSRYTASRKPANNKPEDDEKRFPKGFKKLGRLGTGGFGVVWAGMSSEGDAVAVKQIVKGANSERFRAVRTAKTEIAIAEHLRLEEADRENSEGGAQFIARLFRSVETRADVWLVFEKGGTTINKAMYAMKGEFYNSARIYTIRHTPLYELLRIDRQHLKQIFRDLLQAIAFLAKRGIVHADLKPDNILVEETQQNDNRKYSVRIVDFGSSYKYQDPGSGAGATPEYLPPEVNACNSSMLDSAQVERLLVERSAAHSVDIWGLGSVLLEIVCGFPLWLSYKARVVLEGGKNCWLKGLLAVNGRSTEKIVVKQHEVSDHLEDKLSSYPGLWEGDENDPMVDLLRRMLHLDPAQRIAPTDALEHSFLR